MWQDIVLSVGGFMFSIALIPTIRSNTKPSKTTCATTAFFLWLYCAVYVSLSLWLALASGILSAGAWTILLLQRRVK